MLPLHKMAGKAICTDDGSWNDDLPHLVIHTLEWLAKNGEPSALHGRCCHYFTVVWITNGAGHCMVDHRSLPVETNTLFFLPPGKKYRLDVSDGTQGTIVYFTSEFLYMKENGYYLTSLLNSIYSYSDLVVTRVTRDVEREMAFILTKMSTELSHYFLLRIEILQNLLQVFLVYFSRLQDPSTFVATPICSDGLSARFMSLIEKHFLTKKLVSEYADELCISANYLNNLVKKTTGFSASFHIQQRIVLEAKRQAMYSGAHLKEIAYSLGFTDPAHFSKYFKTFAGSTYSTFKKHCKSVAV